MCDRAIQITIYEITGATTGEGLKGCYFQWVKDDGGFSIYNFFDKNGDLIIPNLRVGEHFDFVLSYTQDIVWALTMKAGSCTYVTGTWLDSKSSNMPEPDQSYQAQAGGTYAVETVVDETIAVAATA